jgi:Tfp pilus assembly protein PilX
MEIFMKSLFNKTGNEEGSALIVALLFLVLLTIIGISASTTSQIEINIAANQKTHEMAFNHSDSGIYATPKLISTCIESGAEQTAAGFTYLGIEFASGAEGIGVGSAGGVAIFYDMDSLGNGPASSVSDIGGVYRKVVGVPGGL